MVVLEDIKNSGGDMVELGDNHAMDPPNGQRRTVWLLVIDVHVNLNIVPLEPVTDLPHRLTTSICHLRHL